MNCESVKEYHFATIFTYCYYFALSDFTIFCLLKVVFSSSKGKYHVARRLDEKTN